MRGYVLVNETGDAAISWDLLNGMARVLAAQQVELADWWERRPLPVSVAATLDDVPKEQGLVIAHVLEVLDDPDALAYHTIDRYGRPLIRIGWGIIRANGGTLTGPNSLLTAASHELCENTVDPYCDFMVDMPDGVNETPIEVCDWVQGYSYEQESGLYVSDFCGPRAFSQSAGMRDREQKLGAAFTLGTGGYWSLRKGGPSGAWSDVFGAHPHEGGMAPWMRDAKLRPGTRHQRRRAA